MRASQSRRGGILFGLLLTAFAMVCLVIAGGLYLARNVRVQTSQRVGGADVSIETPAGHLSVRAHEGTGAAVSDVPLYPGARQTKDSGGGAVVEWTSGNGKGDGGLSVSASSMVTPDSVDKVVDYYKAQLPNWMIVHERGCAVRMELDQGGYKRIVGIKEKYDGTHIAVASIGEPASN
jgi:hypothetical protein